MDDGNSIRRKRGCRRLKKRNFINIKLGIYNALYLFYFSSDDLQRNIPDTGGCISGRIYNSCDDVYG